MQTPQRHLLWAAPLLLLCASSVAQQASIGELTVDWNKTIATSKSTPTLQVVVNPQLLRGAKLHDSSFAALHALGADYVRYVPWLPYPRQAVAELAPPADGKTSWDFSHIDPTLDDFMKATAGHSVILNFSTIPAWMFKTDKPVTYPNDPNQVIWNYTQGTELRDPSMHEVTEYYVRLLQWYTQGGFKDEAGVFHSSGHHYKIAYWEVLNEIDFEHHWTPETYTRFYDSVTTAMRAVDPQLKFMALAMAQPSNSPAMFEYFLNPANHKPGVPLDFITYHFYASPTADQGIDDWQYTFFDQEEGFLNIVRYVEEIRKRLSPSTRTDLDELGVILKEDEKEINHPGYVAHPEPEHYWNLAGALYADLYIQLTRLGIGVVGESQLVGYRSQFPSVSMMNYETGDPNPRFWVLKLLKNNYGPGDTLVQTSIDSKAEAPEISAQAFRSNTTKTLLLINRRNHAQHLRLPEEASGATVSYVAPSTGDREAANETLASREIVLQPFEVAVVHFR